MFLGNVLRGIGETPVQPLGISYIDDYAQSENAAFYIGNAPYLLSMLIALGCTKIKVTSFFTSLIQKVDFYTCIVE